MYVQHSVKTFFAYFFKILSYVISKITNCTFEDNITSGAGGAIRYGGKDLLLENNRFSRNVSYASNGHLQGMGGHIFISPDLTIDDNPLPIAENSMIIDNNTFTQGYAGWGGAIAVQNSFSDYYPDIISEIPTLELSNNEFKNNTGAIDFNSLTTS